MVINHFLNGMIRTPWFKSPLSGSGGGTPSKWPFMAEKNGGEPLKQVLGWSSKCIPKKFHFGPCKVTAAQERIVFYPCIQIQRLCLHFWGCNGKMVRVFWITGLFLGGMQTWSMVWIWDSSYENYVPECQRLLKQSPPTLDDSNLLLYKEIIFRENLSFFNGFWTSRDM